MTAEVCIVFCVVVDGWLCCYFAVETSSSSLRCLSVVQALTFFCFDYVILPILGLWEQWYERRGKPHVSCCAVVAVLVVGVEPPSITTNDAAPFANTRGFWRPNPEALKPPLLLKRNNRIDDNITIMIGLSLTPPIVMIVVFPYFC